MILGKLFPTMPAALTYCQLLVPPPSQPAPLTAALLLTCRCRAGRWKVELLEQPGTPEKELPASGIRYSPTSWQPKKNDSGWELDQRKVVPMLGFPFRLGSTLNSRESRLLKSVG